MAAAPYKRAPITEAIVELRLAAPIAAEQVEKIKDLLAADYPLAPQVTQNVTLRTDSPNATIEFVGYRLFSADATDIANVQRHAFSVSRLAPYTSWEEFTGRARSNWAVWKKVTGWQEVNRIGVRYVNRIDVPNPDEIPIPIEEYLVFRPFFPTFEGAASVDSFAINGAMAIANTNFRLILNAGSTDSPLVRTTSFLLDLDISREIDLPRNDDALWAVIDDIRALKNRVFEASITDQARGLFS
jgi:uncharacterized protein (TIGR04255 family)